MCGSHIFQSLSRRNWWERTFLGRKKGFTTGLWGGVSLLCLHFLKSFRNKHWLMKCHQECSSRTGSLFVKQLMERGFPAQVQRTSSVTSIKLSTCFPPKPVSSSLPSKQKPWYQENFICFTGHSSSQTSASKDHPGNSHMWILHDQTPEHTAQNKRVWNRSCLELGSQGKQGVWAPARLATPDITMKCCCTEPRSD